MASGGAQGGAGAPDAPDAPGGDGDGNAALGQQQPGVRQMMDALGLGDFIELLTAAAKPFSQNQALLNATRGWKLQHIGFFNPNVDISFGSGDHVQIGTDVHYRNVYMFTESVQEHAANPVRREVIARDFSQLLRGDAQAWWSSELDYTTRQQIIGNLELALAKVIFGP